MRPPARDRSPLSFALVVCVAGFGLAAADAHAVTGPPRSQRGFAAVDALGARLPVVAAAHGLTADRLRDLLATDRTLHLTDDFALLYVEPRPNSPFEIFDGPTTTATTAFPESTFALHSRPGAAHTIYLDFDGHVTTGTRWNTQYGITTITSPSFDQDGDPSTFSLAERALIQQVFDGVAEDYRAFDVDVTTEDPGLEALRRYGAGDTKWGIRVVFSEDFTAGACECGGMAFLGYFAANSDTPVFVFNDGSLGELVESASHEVGHSLKLSHDGGPSGEYYAGHGVPDGTTWAPIMGLGFQRLVTQWSRGGYTGATNLEDDLTIITTQNGFGYRPDDHADVFTEATPLAITDAGNGLRATGGAGVLGSAIGDTDCFTFTSGAGPVAFTVRSDPPSERFASVYRPNLNVRARLFDANSVMLASAQGVGTVSLNSTVPGGRYYLQLTGVGAGSPTTTPPTGYNTYGSMGSYDLTGMLPGTGCPVVDVVDPALGPVGSTLTLVGEDLDGVRTLTFAGGVEAIFTLESPTRIHVKIPPGAITGPLVLATDPPCPAIVTKPVGVCADGEECTSVVAVDDGPAERLAIAIAPNPTAGESSLRLTLPRAGALRVRVLDTAGRIVRTLWNGRTEAGTRLLRWDGRDERGTHVTAGVYFVQVTADDESVVRKVLRIR